MADGRELIRTGNYLYGDTVGHDACGIGGVAARDGKPSHEVVRKTLLALKNMEHRGGICGAAGDGAGLLCQLPHGFLPRARCAEQLSALAAPERLKIVRFLRSGP